MASLFTRPFLFQVSPYFRCFSNSAAQPYFVPRNTNGNLPVYSDIRNNGTRYLVHIRGVDGQAHVLAQELRIGLFKAPTAKLARTKVQVQHGKNIVITGTVEKNEVIEWLKARGF